MRKLCGLVLMAIPPVTGFIFLASKVGFEGAILTVIATFVSLACLIAGALLFFG